MPPLKRKRVAGFALGTYVPRPYQKQRTSRAYPARRSYPFSRTGLMTRRSRRAELKNIDIDGINAPALAAVTASVTAINSVVQGITAVTRVGRGAVMRQVEVRLSWGMAATTTLNDTRRVMIVYDRRSNGAAITGATVLEVDSLEAPLNMANAGRFKILYDKTLNVGTAGPQNMNFYYKKKVNLPTNYGLGNGGTVADIASGGISILVWSTGTAGVAVPVLNENYSRVLFEDA